MRPSELRGLQTQPPKPEYGRRNLVDSFLLIYQFASAGGTRQPTSLSSLLMNIFQLSVFNSILRRNVKISTISFYSSLQTTIVIKLNDI
jgi:hypothetical protein